MSKPHRRRTMMKVLAASLVLATPLAFGQSFDTVRLYGAAPGQDGGTVGAALISLPEYKGADKRRLLLLPVLDYQWANGWFAGVSNGIGVNLSSSPQVHYGLRLTVDLGRKESRSPALRGMGDIAAKAEGGAFFNYAVPAGYFLSSSLRYGSGRDGKGLVVDLGAGYATALAAQWRLGLGTSVTLVNAEHMQSFFGVTPAQSAASGYAVYSPGAGVRDLRVNGALTYFINQRTSVVGALSVSSLLGGAKDSPLSRKQSAGTMVLAIAHAF